MPWRSVSGSSLAHDLLEAEAALSPVGRKALDAEHATLHKAAMR